MSPGHSDPPTETAPSATRLWIFRLLALLLVPAAFVAGAELMLRVGGVGYDAGFLVPVEGRAAEPADGVLTTNRKFGWRFFPRALARGPVPLEIVPRDEADEVFRVAVVGGSAARGTPDPAFGLPRLLGEILREQSGVGDVEVLNAAMTAINSHVALPIVRDLLASDAPPDALVIYLGNNEVVGPFGAATVFSPYSPHLGMIRASVWLKGLRFGQLLSGLLAPEPEGWVEWKGMEMFLDQRIGAGDPRLEQVYGHFRANLEDMVRAAEGAGAGVVLSTVAVNLRHQPPFASLHRDDLSSADAERFAGQHEAAVGALDAGRPTDALARLDAVLALDDGHAEVHYHRGRALFATGEVEGAREAFARARDLDALRFRADSRINRVIREVAEEHEVSLVDAAERFAAGVGSHGPLPGRELFFEHVHLSFEGNVALARLVAAELAPLLPGADPGAEALPTSESAAAELAERLPYSPDDALHLERSIAEIVSRPPFTATWGHREDLRRRRARIYHLRRLVAGLPTEAADGLYERRLRDRPDDLRARRRRAEILQRRGEHRRAAEEWARILDRLPGVPGWVSSRADALASAGDVGAARELLREALQRFPDERTSLLLDLGAVEEKAGDADAAAERYRRALEAEPGNPLPAYNLATLAARRGDLERAVELYRQIVAEHPGFHRAHHNLGVAHEQRGDLEAAAAAYEAEIEADPTRARAHASLGVVREAQGRPQEAFELYQAALEREPDHAPALFHLADFLLARGRAAEAAELYRRGLELEPGNGQALENLRLAVGMAESKPRQP